MTTTAPHDTPWRPYTRGDGQVHVGGDNHGTTIQLFGAWGDRLPVELRRMLQEPVTPRLLRQDTFSLVEKTFVPPPGYSSLRNALSSNRTVVLSGEPGTGRRTTALMLLRSVLPDDGTCRELVDDSDDGMEPELGLDELEENDGLLLDLSSATAESADRLLTAVQRKRQDLDEKRCHLVVLLSRDVSVRLSEPWSRFVRTLEPPPALQVLANHLAVHGVEHSEAELDGLVDKLATRRMTDLAELAAFAAVERDRDPHGTFEKWTRHAHTAVSHKATEVSRWFDSHPSGHDRALILSAAMLEGSSTDAVWEARKELRRTVQFAEPDAPPLEHQGLSGHLDTVGFEVDGYRRVRFRRTDFHHRHVRDYFWGDHPELREPLRRWVERLVRHPALTPTDRLTLTLRFTEQCLAIDHPDHVVSVVAAWARLSDKDVEDLLDCVHAMLRAGLLDERHGAYFRYRIREWARRGTDLSARFHSLLVRLCAEVIAPLHPAQALVRLRHLAHHPDPDVSEYALDTLDELARERLFLRRVVHKLGEELGKQRLRDVELFFRVVDPRRLLDSREHGRPLLTDRVVRDQLIDCWRLVQRHDLDVWEGGAYSWFTAALDSADRDSVLALLVQAAGEDGLAVSRLEHAARTWVRSIPDDQRPGGRALLTELVHRLDASQNLHFLAPQGEPR
ncbi:hypothetical protein [Saccharomonospora viridis]|jgi:hypothetical protein|uniref:Novel STAND NTPase 3 domain-containing protein n=1 Tax=Saccharomonospora viridis (strain ATCC 15386 / DSM 43017 / JCM 3036 / CCUG 5913 / NBRC 12207 / NCIMB 9602 / P101) TaxID=471857 RepID=C7MUJ8_SACVD|nr:hypothetical protein [Saccharomonospora viridis]ACU97674.1 hypothetical protein Svir_26900 [Saccharomonospora viridis DSM 43017]